MLSQLSWWALHKKHTCYTTVLGWMKNMTCLVVGACPRLPSSRFGSHGKLRVNNCQVVIRHSLAMLKIPPFYMCDITSTNSQVPYQFLRRYLCIIPLKFIISLNSSTSLCKEFAWNCNSYNLFLS